MESAPAARSGRRDVSSGETGADARSAREKMRAMEPRVDALVLWARPSLTGLLAFGLGAVGHVTAGGLLPSPVFLAVLLVFMVLLGVPMLHRPASSLRIVAMLVGGQSIIHLVLSATAGHRGDESSPGMAGLASSGAARLRELPVVDGHRVGSLQDAYQGMSGQPTSFAPTLPVGHLITDLSAHAPMMVVHLAAAVLVGLWLGRGEQCLWTLIALTGRRVIVAAWSLAPVATMPRPGLAAAVHAEPELRASRWQALPRSRRGPPLLAA